MHNRILILLRDRLPRWLLYAAPPLLAFYVVALRRGRPVSGRVGAGRFLDKLVGGTARLRRLLRAAQEHRILVPRLIIAADHRSAGM